MAVFTVNKILLIILAICIISATGLPQGTPYSYDNQLDINNASFEEITRLPVSEEIAERIYDRITYQGPLGSIYQLRDIEGIDQELFLKLKPMIRIEPYMAKSEREERIEDLYYKLDRWEGGEGADQALVDLWIEQALEPVDINEIRYEQLQNLQGVSPVDAAAIIRYRNTVGEIASLRDLRSAPNLSYYGYRNARDFISFEPTPQRNEFHGHLLTRTHNTPFLTEEAEATGTVDPSTIDNNYPEVYTRFMGSWGRNIKFGMSHWHSLYEPVINQDLGFMEIPKPKFYIGIENQKWGQLELRKFYVGNYAIAFGQGVVMENTDFFTPRKTGFGWRKRFIGLSGDNSRTRQYKLSGAAAQLAWRNFNLFLFGSFDKRDAILNKAPETHFAVNQFIVLDQRFEYALNDATRESLGLSWRNSVKELLYGAHFSYDVVPATQVGFTYYESAYDRLLRPDIADIYDEDQTSLADNEILNSYGGPISDGTNPFWSDAKSFRRIYGVDLQTVFENVSLQAEYAELDKASLLDKNPSAFVGSAYIQYNSFNLLGLYRNYDLGFDNPYQRSTSNYRRFKRTIYEDYFYLQDPLYVQLYSNNPQPQAERGFYIRSRYQINRNFIFTTEYDTWVRKADDASQFRVVGTLEFRPIFPLRINLRQKYQGREKQDQISTEYFENFEFRGRMRIRLSRFDELGFIYSSALTKFRPRPRLYYPTQSGDSLDLANTAGNIGSPGEALGGFYTHNFNEWLKLKGFVGYYQGFYWTFEDTQFLVLDSQRGAMRFWISLYSRISNNISMRIKYTRDYQYPITYTQTRDTYNEPIGPISQGRYYQGNLIQPTQDFYYLEVNYHF
jgi:DNA uptake protein ComE-like DNA-binding protein